MNEGEQRRQGSAPIPYEYWYDGLIRRQLHEFGWREERKFVHDAIAQLGYGPGDIALDVGAGMGHDGAHIAWEYRPKILFLLEPLRGAPEDFDNRYYQIGQDIAGHKLGGINVLSSSVLSDTLAELPKRTSAILHPGTTYIQPVPGVAEAIPMPDNSVTKVSSIYSIYEYTDPHAALAEIVRVMTPDASGVVITNGPEDKIIFKEILDDGERRLNAEDPQEDPDKEYKAPSTVSSRLNYSQAMDLLTQYFEEVYLITYRDAMKITADRMPLYVHSYNSYRRGFRPEVSKAGLWAKVREAVLIERINREMARNNGIFWDTIDTGAVFFRYPKK